jgi:hypothetical protein
VETDLSVEESVVKSNGDDGLESVESDGPLQLFFFQVKANYNKDWGIDTDVIADARDYKNTAVGNGQAQQCRNIQCN